MQLDSASIASTWALYSVCTASMEVAMGIFVPAPGRVFAFLAQVAWAASVFLLWSPKLVHQLPGGVGTALCAHGALHAFIWLRYSALFSLMFPTVESRSSAVSFKQQSVVAGLIAGTFGVSYLSGTRWVQVQPVATFLGAAALLFSCSGGLALVLHRESVSDSSTEPAAGKLSTALKLAQSKDFWVFLGVDWLSALANGLITNTFPLLVAHIYGFSSDRVGVALKVGPWMPAAVSSALQWVLPASAQIGTPGTSWDVLIPGSALLPCLYLVFYLTGAAVGPLWASAAKVRWTAWRRLWQLGSAAYAVALYTVLGSQSYHGLLLQVALQGAMVCVFLVLPELFTGAVVDQVDAPARRQAAQMLTASKAVSRRMGGAVQGAISAAVLAQAGFVSASDLPTAQSYSAIASLFAWYPIALLLLSAVLVDWFKPGERLVRIVVGRRAVQRLQAKAADAQAADGSDGAGSDGAGSSNGEDEFSDVLASRSAGPSASAARGVSGARQRTTAT